MDATLTPDGEQLTKAMPDGETLKAVRWQKGSPSGRIVAQIARGFLLPCLIACSDGLDPGCPSSRLELTQSWQLLERF